MSDVIVIIEAEVNPTEDPEKVKAAIENLFTLSAVEFTARGRGSLLIAKSEGREGLSKFYNLLRQQRIIAAARRVLNREAYGGSVTFCLKKQAAYMKHVSFCEPAGEEPLGPIRVEIKTGDVKSLIDWMAPRMDMAKDR